MEKSIIGFIGQGFIGKNMADDFEERGYVVIRYALEPEYADNKERIKEADIVFVAVPTPTRPEGFDDSILRSAVKIAGAGKTVVIKSTILPGSTESIQEENPGIFVLHSPEFLTEVNAKQDTRKPLRNLIGIPKEEEEWQKRAEQVLSVLPKAPYERVLKSKETEMVKYVGNNFLFTKVVFMNLMYDLSQRLGADWLKVAEAVASDPRIGSSHMLPVHPSGLSAHPGRGAGGHCFPKDFEALLRFYRERMDDDTGFRVLEALKDKNIELLRESGKDADILAGIYNNLQTDAEK